MRSFAILGVLFGHLFVIFTPLASLGVELFFVLSGFLIGGILLKTLESNNGLNLPTAFNFLTRRWFRTVPNYFLFLLINYICFRFFIGQQFLPKDLWPYFLFSQNLVTPPGHFFSESWSLCVEEWFYLTIPFAYLIIHNLFRKTSPKKVFLIVATLFLIIPGLLRFNYDDYNTITHMIVLLRLDSIMFGVIMAFIYKYVPALWSRFLQIRFISLGLFLVIIVISYLHPKLNVKVLDSIIPLVFALTIPFFKDLKSPSQTIFRNSVTNTSTWSYSIYLVHLPLFLSTRDFVTPYLDDYFKILIYRGTLIVLTFFISWFIFTYYEHPLTEMRDRFSRKE